MSWTEVQLGDAIHVKHGYAFKGQFFTDSGTHIVLTPGNFDEGGGFRLRPGKDRFYSRDIPEEHILKEDDLIVAMTEQGPGLLGSSALVPESGRYLHNQRLGLVQIREDTVFDRRFLYYLFNTRGVREQISGSATGTKVRHTAPERIYRVIASVPSNVEEQRKIGQILFSYDNLIENNRRRIHLLEQTARLIYEEWFIHLQFPGRDRVTITDGVPEGWERKTVPEIIEISPQVDIPKNISIRYIPMAGLSTSGMTVDLTNSETRTKSTSVRFRNGDTLLARITPCLENGKTGFVNFLRDGEVACGSTEFIVLRGRSVSSFFTYCLARTYDFRQTAIKSMIGSSGRQRVQPSCFDDVMVVRPCRSFRDEFDNICDPIFSQIAGLTSEIYSLTRARDLVLPRLMNGKIAV